MGNKTTKIWTHTTIPCPCCYTDLWVQTDAFRTVQYNVHCVRCSGESIEERKYILKQKERK